MIATPVVEVTCVCGATVAVVEDDAGKPGVMHAMPMCPDFESRGPTEYLRWFNDHIEARTRGVT